jgi:hypothetical protein
MAILALGAAAHSASAATSVDVFVGYADTLRADAANFPTPWNGAPGVTFRGCKGSACKFDASAVRIVNNTRAVQLINSLTVTIGSCAINLWPGASTLLPGGQLIVTQTAATPAEGCAAASGSIDGSEIGSKACSPDGIVPEVDVSINGSASKFTDTGQVLNTGGVDPYRCGLHNESTQWTKIGSAPCAGATLTIAPPTQTHHVRQRAAVVATLSNGCATGLQGVDVTLVAKTGPDAGKTWTAATNASGVASFSYINRKTGTDVLFAGVSNPAGVIYSNAIRARWIRLTAYGGQAYAAALKLGRRAAASITDTRYFSASSSLRKLKKLARLNGGTVRGAGLQASLAIGSGRSLSQASVGAFTIAFKGLPVIRASTVKSSSGSTCTAAAGRATIASLLIATTRIDVRKLAPNTVIKLGKRGTITLDEQRPVVGADHGLIVNAIHVHLPGLADVVIASARSDVHYC